MNNARRAGKAGTLLLAAAFLVACATSQEQDERLEDTAIADFIAVNELASVDVIRTMDQLTFKEVSDEYVLVSTRREDFLLQYFNRCIRYTDGRVEPDFRRDARALYAGADTFRGCRIKAIYALEPGQADEVREIAEAFARQ